MERVEEGEKLEAFIDDFGLLIEAGFVAVKQLDETSARRLFEGAAAISPSHSAPKIGLGYIALNKLDMEEAMAIFSRVVAEEPDNDLAQVFLGICYLLSKSQRDEGEQLIRKMKERSSDPTLIHLATVSLNWLEHDLKKDKAPFFAALERGKIEPEEKIEGRPTRGE